MGDICEGGREGWEGIGGGEGGEELWGGFRGEWGGEGEMGGCDGHRVPPAGC